MSSFIRTSSITISLIHFILSGIASDEFKWRNMVSKDSSMLGV